MRVYVSYYGTPNEPQGLHQYLAEVLTLWAHTPYIVVNDPRDHDTRHINDDLAALESADRALFVFGVTGSAKLTHLGN